LVIGLRFGFGSAVPLSISNRKSTINNQQRFINHRSPKSTISLGELFQRAGEQAADVGAA
jgi:hypothetical protein